MIKGLFQAAALAMVLLLAGCSKPQPEAGPPQKPVEIEGQVFVIQKDRTNVKLGGVEIHYVPREAFQARCRWIEKNSPKAVLIARYEGDLHRIDTAINSAARERHAGKLGDFLSVARERQADAWLRLKENPALVDHRLHWLAARENRQSFEDAGFEGSDEQWKLAALFFQWLAEHAVLTTQTDADGNYAMSLPAPGEGFIFARASRQLTTKQSESYLWIQKVSSTTTGPVHLASTGCLSSPELRDFLLTSAAVGNPSMKEVLTEYGLRDLSWFKDAEELLDKIATNESSVAKLKGRLKELDAEIQATKYRDLSSP